MVYLEILGPILVALGVLATLIMAFGLRRVLGKRAPFPPLYWPPVSILKPLKGVDPGLSENLRSFMDQDYPGEFEIVMGTADADDPAIPVAWRSVEIRQKSASAFGPVTILSDGRTVGANPKVNSLVNLMRHAKHDLVLVSDSNVRVRKDYLENLVATRSRAGGGLAWSVFQGAEWGGFWAGLEALQLHGMVMGGMATAHEVLGTPCALGKSMLLSKSDLDAIGGLERFGEYLAEDQVIAEEVVKAGLPVSIANSAVENSLGSKTAAGFSSRYLRWAKLRRHLDVWNYVGEFFLNPVFVGVALASISRSPWLFLASGLALAATVVIDRSTERLLKIRRSIPSYVLSEAVLALLKGVFWFVPFFSNTVVWRGNRLRIGPRSRITKITPVPDLLAAPGRVIGEVKVEA